MELPSRFFFTGNVLLKYGFPGPPRRGGMKANFLALNWAMALLDPERALISWIGPEDFRCGES
jgi:hypothetical protein